MTLLEEFVFSLSKTMREKLRPLQFRGVKRKIFFSILDRRTQDNIPLETIVKRYKLTKKRYYLMHSEMLKASYRDIVPAEGTALLLFLGNMQLFRHFLHEMKKQESDLVGRKNSQALTHYYFQMLLMRNLLLLHPKFNEDIVHELSDYVNRYIAVRGSQHPHDAAYRRTIEINREIEDPMEGFHKQKIAAFITELEQIFETVKQGDHLLAQYTVSDTLLMLISRYHVEGKSAAPYAEYGTQLMNEHPNEFRAIRDFYELECLQFLSTDQEDKIQRFKKFLTESSKNSGASLYYIGRFFLVIVRSGEHKWAKEFIDKHFPYNIDLLRNDLALNYWYILMMYNIHLSNYEVAERCLQKAFTAGTGKNREIHPDLMLRCYDVYFTALKGDPITLEKTVDRHMRFAYRHDFKRGETHQMIFLEAVGDLCKHINFNAAKAKRVKEKFIATPGAARLANVFQHIYDTYFKS